MVPTAGTRDMSSPPQENSPTQAQTINATRKHDTFRVTMLPSRLMMIRPTRTHASAQPNTGW